MVCLPYSFLFFKLYCFVSFCFASFCFALFVSTWYMKLSKQVRLTQNVESIRRSSSPISLFKTSSPASFSFSTPKTSVFHMVTSSQSQHASLSLTKTASQKSIREILCVKRILPFEQIQSLQRLFLYKYSRTASFAPLLSD